jgi:hypothetical protein
MPVSLCENGKWRIGAGSCIYSTREKAIEVWTAILAQGKYEVAKKNIDAKKKDTTRNESELKS